MTKLPTTNIKDILVWVFLIVMFLALFWLLLFRNPIIKKGKQIQEHHDQLLVEIKKARSYEDCENLWNMYTTSQLMQAMDLNTLQGVRAERSNNKIYRALEQVTNAVGQSGIYMVQCLRHLEEKTIIPLSESVPKFLANLKKKEES